MNALFRGLFLARIAAAIADACAAAAVPHNGVRGQVREILIRELFRSLLPADVSVGHGHIVSAVEDKVSAEQDVVSYDRRLVPPVLYEGSLGMFPLECTLAAIEVTSQLTLGELRDADAKAAILFEFKYQSGVSAVRLPPGGVPVDRVFSAVFALDTDLSESGKTEMERYESLPSRHAEALRAICVVGRGYWFRSQDTGKATSRRFEFAEVAAFIAVRHADDVPNRVLYACTVVVDAKPLKELVESRAGTRRLRRTRKTHHRRLRRLAQSLADVPNIETRGMPRQQTLHRIQGSPAHRPLSLCPASGLGQGPSTSGPRPAQSCPTFTSTRPRRPTTSWRTRRPTAVRSRAAAERHN
jgi:hypothetical protein